ncbi:MAG: aminotransferase class I/II-fold pyridoxal phosphate-dependent enzyme [Acidobacteria bacterium]|nr:aminotransferase class I/II-fold pyridoxal phosphate-dependent enzyme [Acidobacteriota bacterium]
MRIPDFLLERFFARYEFQVPYVLCASDVEAWPMAEVLALADDETRALWNGLRLGYTESTGHPLLRAEIARALFTDLSADDVLVFSGASEGIFVLVNVVLRPGDHAVVVWPAYQSLHEVARSLGAEVTLVELHESEGWALDPARVRAALAARTKLIVLNVPHNPTGMLPDPATYRAIVEIAREAGAILLSDEVYRGLEYDAADRLPSGADLGQHVVSLGVMSKSLAMAGLRIGWIATRNRALLDAAARFKDYTTLCPPAPSELLALIALRAVDTVLERSREIVRGNLALAEHFFERRATTISWVRPRAGSVGFPRLAPGIDANRFAADLAEQDGVLLAPGRMFGRDDGHVRLGLGRRNFPEALARLDAFLDRR